MPRRLTPRSVIYQSSVAMYHYSYKGCPDWEDSPFGATNIYTYNKSYTIKAPPMTAKKLDGHIVTSYIWMSYLLEHLAHASVFTCLPIAASRYRVTDLSPETEICLEAYKRALRERKKVMAQFRRQPSLRRYVCLQIQRLREKHERKNNLFENDFRRASFGSNYRWWGAEDEYEAVLLNFGPICQEGMCAWAVKVWDNYYEPMGRIGQVYRSLIR